MCTMFCYQCEQTAQGRGCTGNAGNCGKSAETATLQDLLLRLVQEMARQQVERSCSSQSLDDLTCEALFSTVTNVNFSSESIEKLCRRTACESGRKLPAERFDLLQLGERIGIDAERTRLGQELSDRLSLVLFALKGIAAYYYHAARLGYRNPEIPNFLRRALAYLLHPDIKSAEMIKFTLECGTINLKTLELLDRANHETFGVPEPTQVRITPIQGKAILVTGHDLGDLAGLLEATKGMPIHVYTHGEMLPANSYPKLKAYPNLVGNYGGAWHDQNKEFAEFPGPIYVTGNCLQPPLESYRTKIFTTGPVACDNTIHLKRGEYAPIIEAALLQPGFAEPVTPEKTILIGFPHEVLESRMGKILELLNAGKLRHIFVIGGCDGAKSGRNYYTHLVEDLPKDCIILTLGCCKYRFNKMHVGEIDGFPRLLDLGQCNDAYSAIRLAITLADACHCTVNQLPLSIILSWYEQKAVAVFLTLLSLGVQNIKFGPSMPAFVSPDMKTILEERFHIRPIDSAPRDVAECLHRV